MTIVGTEPTIVICHFVEPIPAYRSPSPGPRATEYFPLNSAERSLRVSLQTTLSLGCKQSGTWYSQAAIGDHLRRPRIGIWDSMQIAYTAVQNPTLHRVDLPLGSRPQKCNPDSR